MARLVALFLVAAVLSAVTHGYELRSAKRYVSGLPQKATTEEMSLPRFTETAPVRQSRSRFICPRDGLFPDLMDCNQYIQCTEGRAYVMSCPEGLHFSTVTQRCESPCVAQCDSAISCKWKQSANKKKSSESQSVLQDFTCSGDDLFSHPNNCSKFIQCHRGQKHVKTCRSGFHFSRKTLRCARPCDAHCDNAIAEECGWDEETTTPQNDFEVCRRRPYTGPCDKYVTRYYFDINEGTCKTFRYGGCHSNGNNFKSERECSIKCLRTRTDALDTQTEPDPFTKDRDLCIREGLYRNPEDCTTYVQCSGGLRYVMPCPRGLHFSEEIGRCETPCDAHCDNSIADECNWFDNFVKSLESPKSEDLHFCSRDGLFPHPEDCHSYIRCSDGIANVLDCPEDRQHFSLENQRCESACDAHCDPTLAEECGWEDKKYGILKEGYACVKSGLHPHPEDCATYIQCWKGQGYIMPCPVGMHYSPRTERCEEPCEAGCYAPMEYTEMKPHFEVLCSSGSVYQHHRNPENCSTYIQCSRYGRGYVMNCPFGHHFSELTLTCESPCRAHCDPGLAQACEWEERSYSLKQPVFDFACLRNGLFENHADCGTFVQCTGGSAYLISCSFGLHFNPVTRKCESPCDAGCDPNIEEQCREGATSFGRYPYIPLRDPSLRQPVYHRRTCQEDAFYPDLEDCGKYIQCSDGHSFVMPCPGGMHFSQETNMCEPPCDAHCDPAIAERCGWDGKAHSPRRMNFRQCKPNERYALPDDCTRYVQCTEMGSGAYVMTCPEGLHFSGAFCLEPCEAKCDPSLAESCHWNSEAAVLSAAESEWVTWTDDFTGMVDFHCFEDGLFKNPDDCTTYYRCHDGRAHARSCPDDQHYSESSERCESQCDAHCNMTLACECEWEECSGELRDTQDHNVDVCRIEPDAGPCQDSVLRYYYDSDGGRCRMFTYGGCAGNSNNFETLEECNAKCTEELLGGYRCPEDNGKFGNYPDCTRYYECKRGVPTLKRCPKGTAFDHLKAKCVTEFKATCVYHCREPDAVYPYVKDCHKYIDCVNGVPKVERCPPGTAFDPVKRDCVDAQDTSCPLRLVERKRPFIP